MAININAKTSGVGGLETTADNSGNINIQSGGSTVMSVTSSGVAVTGSFSQNGAVYSTQPSFRNLIINGDMRIDQRNAGASVTPTNAQYHIDRWRAYLTQASKYTVQQSTTAPSGFNYSLLATSSSAYTVGASDYFLLAQPIEGLNSAHLAWGTSAAKTVTLSFWVRSSLTGTFGGAIGNSAGSRSYPYSYTISSADTWEKKTITITGDTSGTWVTTNASSIVIYWSLGSGATFSGTSGAWSAGTYTSATGATSVVGTSGATFYITGVQLEVGSTATDFENLPFDMQLLRCQRYYWKSVSYDTVPGTAGFNGVMRGLMNGAGNRTSLGFTYTVPMRATPTCKVYNPTTGTIDQIRNEDANSNVSATIYGSYTTTLTQIDATGTAGNIVAAYVTATAEL